MKQRLKILHLEDIADDAELVARVLKNAAIDCDILQVDNKEDFIESLKNNLPDIVLSDHSLPSFDSHEALEIVKEINAEIPFILVTATVSEEYAVNILKKGASDYILKERLQRLPTAIWGAIEKYNAEKARKQAEETLRTSEKKYRLLFDNNPLPMWMVSKSTFAIIAVNDAAVRHYGYSQDEFITMNSNELLPLEDVEIFMSQMQQDYSGINKAGTWRHIKKDGAVIIVDIVAHDVLFEGSMARLILGNDVTEKVNAETDLAEQRMQQQKLITETSIRVQEREREEIGKELHDNINQILATAKLYLDFAIQKDNLRSDSLGSCRSNILLAIEEIRKLSHNLVAPSLGNITLVQAINDLIHEIHSTTALQMNLSAKNYDESLLDKDIKLLLYRIIQEQVNNILKHSGAKTATIVLYTVNNHIHLSVKDDGIGFESSKKTEGIGFRNISNRVSFYDGEVRLLSQPGKGCILEAMVPLKQQGYLRG